MDGIEHLRGIPALRPLRGRHPAVVVCLDDPAPYEARRDELARLDATLVVEREPGELSARLGRPSVTVTDRFLDVFLRGRGPHDAPPDAVCAEVQLLEIRCEECPQSGVDMRWRATS